MILTGEREEGAGAAGRGRGGGWRAQCSSRVDDGGGRPGGGGQAVKLSAPVGGLVSPKGALPASLLQGTQCGGVGDGTWGPGELRVMAPASLTLLGR